MEKRYQKLATMKFYPFYTGDYVRDTLELDAAEDGIYIRLLNWYYSNEKPIPDDRVVAIARVTSDAEINKTHWVLSRFFKREVRDEVVWVNSRCDKEIKKANKRINAAILNGKKGGRPRNNKPTGLAKQNPTLNPAETQWQSSPDPDPDLKNKTGDTSAPVTPWENPDSRDLKSSPSKPLVLTPGTTGANKRKAAIKKARYKESKSGPTWEAYSTAYELRYGVPPKRSAKSSTLCCGVIDEIGAEAAPDVAAYYVTTNANPYSAGGHCLELLKRDCHKMHMEWMTGNRTTQHRARDMDRLQGDGDGWNKIIEKHHKIEDEKNET